MEQWSYAWLPTTPSPHLLLDVHEPLEDLLVGEAMQRPRQAIQPGAEGEVGVTERAAHEVRGMGAHVATLYKKETQRKALAPRPLAGRVAGPPPLLC
jgi:hypothetical protein